MGSTADKLSYLLETKNAIKTALINKGAQVDESTPFRDYVTAVNGLSSVIEVSQLPSEGINENGVYKVITQYEASPLTAWIVTPGTVQDVNSILPSGGALNCYVVDELPSSLEVSDMTNYIIHTYVVEETGIGYLNIPGAGVMTAGMAIMGESGCDKGWVYDINMVDDSNPANMGIYFTQQVFKDFPRWYIRINNAWYELSAHISIDGKPTELQGEYAKTGIIDVTMPKDTIDIASYIINNKTIPTIEINVPSTGLLMSGNLNTITKEFFYDPTNGEYLRYIRAGCFYGYGNLRNIELPEDMLSIDRHAFTECSSLVLTELPESITTIGYGAFIACSSLALTKLPSGINEILPQAFDQCTSLALTELPENIMYIRNTTFRNCYNLAISELPASLIELDSEAFNGCIGLTSITFKGTPSKIDWTAFINCDNLTVINVPWAEGAVYGAPWGATNATINYNYIGE